MISCRLSNIFTKYPISTKDRTSTSHKCRPKAEKIWRLLRDSWNYPKIINQSHQKATHTKKTWNRRGLSGPSSKRKQNNWDNCWQRNRRQSKAVMTSRTILYWRSDWWR
jgi:hypothetical protein